MMKILESKMNPTIKPTPEDRIIHYTTLDKLVDYVLQIKLEKEFKIPLLYVNKGWQYGAIKKDTIVLKNNKQEFMTETMSIYNTSNTHIGEVEIICQIPLPNNIFKFLFVSSQNGGYKEKYLKYKKKYLELKEKLYGGNGLKLIKENIGDKTHLILTK